MSWCGYCHHPATYYCSNPHCRSENSRATVCKECGMHQKFICQHCGSKMLEEDEIEKL